MRTFRVDGDTIINLDAVEFVQIHKITVHVGTGAGLVVCKFETMQEATKAYYRLFEALGEPTPDKGESDG